MKDDAVDTGSLVVRPIVRGEVERFNGCLDEYHWLGRGLTGQVMRYVATIDGSWVAVVGFGSAALSCAVRDRHIGWSRAQQYQRLRFVMNNQRFCVLPPGRRPNLASAVLSRVLRRLSDDCVVVHGHPIVGVETFTDPSRHAGTCYAAANFTPLGQTLGYRRSGGTYHHHGNPKVLWWRPLRRDATQILAADFDHRALCAPDHYRGPMLDLDTIDFGSLRSHLADHLDDWRMRRGIRHNHGSLFTIAVAAALSGARSIVAIGEFASDLSQEALARLGARNTAGTFVAPHVDTFRRAFAGVDVEGLDTAIGSWLRANLPTSALDAIALDGKTLRGAWTPEGTQVHLLAAMVHNQGAVLAQREVPTGTGKTNEITQVRPLLEDLDIDGTVVTVDALHTQRDHAKFLVAEKNADYVFTVKANQPNLLAEIETRFDGPFSPSPRNH